MLYPMRNMLIPDGMTVTEALDRYLEEYSKKGSEIDTILAPPLEDLETLAKMLTRYFEKNPNKNQAKATFNLHTMLIERDNVGDLFRMYHELERKRMEAI